MQLVHVVSELLSHYLRYEMDGYCHTVAADEDVRILSRPQARALELPEEDFWLFDDGPVTRMRYDREGAFLGAELAKEPDVVGRYCRWRDVALQAATPYAWYVEQHQGVATSHADVPEGEGCQPTEQYVRHSAPCCGICGWAPASPTAQLGERHSGLQAEAQRRRRATNTGPRQPVSWGGGPGSRR
jgi:hypothetical protein